MNKTAENMMKLNVKILLLDRVSTSRRLGMVSKSFVVPLLLLRDQVPPPRPIISASYSNHSFIFGGGVVHFPRLDTRHCRARHKTF